MTAAYCNFYKINWGCRIWVGEITAKQLQTIRDKNPKGGWGCRTTKESKDSVVRENRTALSQNSEKSFPSSPTTIPDTGHSEKPAIHRNRITTTVNSRSESNGVQPAEAAHKIGSYEFIRDSSADVARCACDAPFSPGGDKGVADDYFSGSAPRYDIAGIRAVTSRIFKNFLGGTESRQDQRGYGTPLDVTGG